MAGQVAQGITLGINAGGTATTYTTIAEVTSIDGPNQERDDIETTHLTSANNKKEFLPGLTDPGELEIEFNYLPGNASQEQIATELASLTTKGFKITFSDTSTSTVTFLGYVKAFGHSGETGDKMSGKATIKVTGTPSYS